MGSEAGQESGELGLGSGAVRFAAGWLGYLVISLLVLAFGAALARPWLAVLVEGVAVWAWAEALHAWPSAGERVLMWVVGLVRGPDRDGRDGEGVE